MLHHFLQPELLAETDRCNWCRKPSCRSQPACPRVSKMDTQFEVMPQVECIHLRLGGCWESQHRWRAAGVYEGNTGNNTGCVCRNTIPLPQVFFVLNCMNGTRAPHRNSEATASCDAAWEPARADFFQRRQSMRFTATYLPSSRVAHSSLVLA